MITSGIVILVIISGLFLGFLVGMVVIGRKLSEKIDICREEILKRREFCDVLIQWIHVHQKGRTLADFFYCRNYNNIAIYGLAELGEALLLELESAGIKVSYGIDRKADSRYWEIDVIKPGETLNDVDIVVVTAMHYYAEVVVEMEQSMNCPIVALNDVVYEV